MKVPNYKLSRERERQGDVVDYAYLRWDVFGVFGSFPTLSNHTTWVTRARSHFLGKVSLASRSSNVKVLLREVKLPKQT